MTTVDIAKPGPACTACGAIHFDHSVIHFSLIGDDLAGLCWEEDHYPNEGDLLVTADIQKVTCGACREFRTFDDLKEASELEPANAIVCRQYSPTSGDIPGVCFERHDPEFETVPHVHEKDGTLRVVEDGDWVIPADGSYLVSGVAPSVAIEELKRIIGDAWLGGRAIAERSLLEVGQELSRARSKHGPMNSLHEAYSVILEEVDELWEEVKKKQQLRDLPAIRAELIQIAAMALRAIVDVVEPHPSGLLAAEK